MNWLTTRRFNDLEFWDIIKVLKAFKGELIARENLFLQEPNADLFTALSFLASTEKFQKKAKRFMFISQTCKIVTHIETRANGTKYSRMDQVKFMEDSL